LTGQADLAHDDYVERPVERARNLVSDRHAAARQREHERVTLRHDPCELRRKRATGLVAVVKPSRHSSD
jgi:hypothetical protein